MGTMPHHHPHRNQGVEIKIRLFVCTTRKGIMGDSVGSPVQSQAIDSEMSIAWDALAFTSMCKSLILNVSGGCHSSIQFPTPCSRTRKQLIGESRRLKSRSPSRLRLRPPSFRLNSISQARAYKRCPIILISLLEMPLPHTYQAVGVVADGQLRVLGRPELFGRRTTLQDCGLLGLWCGRSVLLVNMFEGW